MFFIHFGFDGYIPLLLYSTMIVALSLSITWKPQIGLYCLIPLLPAESIRWRILTMPMGTHLVDIMVGAVLVGALIRHQAVFKGKPLAKPILALTLITYISV